MWREPTTDDLRDAMLEAELSAFSRVSVATGKDPVAKAIDNAVGRFRAALRSGARVSMGPDRTLPHDLIPQAMQIAAYFYIGSRVGAKVSEARTTLYNDAIKLAERIESGTVKYTEPDETETAVKSVGPRPISRPKRMTLSRRQQEGI
jgi:phage gp36-like protein